jgi:AcrR family transcriptional regulator
MSQVRRTQAARSQHARDQIVQAALTVFALKGYAASSMDDICMAAGCSKGGLYHHFPTKAAVLSGVVDRLSTQGGLLPPLAAAGVVDAPRALGRVLIEIWTEASRDDGLRTRLRAGYEAQLDLRLQDPERSDGTLATILRIGALIQMLTRNEAIDAREAARRLGIEQAA